MKEIFDNRGRVYLVDNRDYAEISSYSWNGKPYSRGVYAVRVRRKADGPGTRCIWLHRQIWSKYNGPIPEGFYIDHIDRNSTNCQLENLRLVTKAQNQANAERVRLKFTPSSVYKGVSWSKANKKWEVGAWNKTRRAFFGFFNNEIEAARQYDREVLKLRGWDYAFTNFPKTDYPELEGCKASEFVPLSKRKSENESKTEKKTVRN